MTLNPRKSEMSTPNPPNIFSFATKELTQDAALAYILAWADSNYSESHPELNQLGESLLRSFISSAAKAAEEPDLLQNITKGTVKVKVGTQRKNMDVWVEINDEIFLIIEDKVGTEEHSKQIQKYKDTASRFKTEYGTAWQQVLAVYVKTGNESINRRIKSAPCGIFLRDQILKVLDEVSDFKNTIIEEFRRHLQKKTDETSSFEESKWVNRKDKWAGTEGFFLRLQQWLPDAMGNSDSDWDYVSNKSGGFLGFWWHHHELPGHRCNLYLQLQSDSRETSNVISLMIRAGSASDENKKQIKVNKDLLWRLHESVSQVADVWKPSGLYADKAGAFRGGLSANVAKICFSPELEDKNILMADADGVLDMPATQQRLSLAMEFLDAVCKKANASESN